jgi:hypothetical protein
MGGKYPRASPLGEGREGWVSLGKKYFSKSQNLSLILEKSGVKILLTTYLG